MRLPELQRALSGALLGGTTGSLLEWIETDAISAEERLNIYRHTIEGTLAKALRLNFPATEQLVGAEFFGQCAAAYAAEEPARSAYLNDYGAGFPAWLAANPQAATVTYLADVARLEWAVSRALYAPAAPAPDLNRLARLDPDQQARVRFQAHPSVTLLALHSPADLIWRAVLDGSEEALAAVNLNDGAAHLLIERLGETLSVRRMPSPEWAFAAALCAGMPLGEALGAHPGVDALAQLALHLGDGRLCAWELPEPAALAQAVGRYPHPESDPS